MTKSTQETQWALHRNEKAKVSFPHTDRHQD